MSRTRGTASNLHRRLTVAWLDADQRSSLTAALTDDVIRLDLPALDELARPAAERRREAEEATDEDLEAELRSLEARQGEAEERLHDLVTEERRLRDAAEWCALQTDADAAASADMAALAGEVDRHGRTAREATRRVERVLEQRAAAEAALEEARGELTGLGATGIDETDVRRHMEAASQELRDATAEYREAMKDVALRRAELDELEKEVEAEAPPAGEPVPEIPHGDQFQAMGRALRAKFGSPGADSPAPSAATPDRAGRSDVDRARDEVGRAKERADEAATRLAAVRRRIDGFETELTARSNDGDARDSRHAAAVALEAQVSSVERQLSEAERTARGELDDATRSASRAELALERLRQERRDRRRKLGELAALVPAADLPSEAGDLTAHAGTIAEALRELVEQMQSDIRTAHHLEQSLRADLDEKASELARRRAGREAILSEDRREALRQLLDDETGVVVLDDSVSVDDGRMLLADDLDALDPRLPVVVLTGDHSVAGWAIELPHERGRLANATELWSLTERDAVPITAANGRHPAPSPAR